MAIPIQHDTVLSLIDLGKLGLTAIVSIAPVVGIALKVRAVQNKNLGINLVKALDAQVKLLKDEVKRLQDRDEKLQTQVGILHSKLNESNEKATTLTKKIDEIEKLLPQLQNTMQGVKSYLERTKQEAAEAAKSKVTFKEEKPK